MKSRLNHLQQIMSAAAVDGFLISSSSNIFYLSGFNRFLEDHDGFLLVTKKDHYLITSPLYTEAVKKFTPDLQILETSPDAWYAQMVKQVAEKQNIKVIGFEEKDLRVAEFFDLEEQKIELKSVSLRNLRLQKDAKEISAISKACILTDKAFEHILPFIKEGVTELDLANKMQEFLKKNNSDMGFPAIVAFGRHSAVPHHMTSEEKLIKNSFVLFDFGVKVDSYLSDMSRTVFYGVPSTGQIKLYETVKKSQQAAIDYIEKKLQTVILGNEERVTPESRSKIDSGQARMTIPDIFTKDVDALSRKVIEDAKFTAYPHALGHGIGLEVHEAPTLSLYSPEKLLDGMVFTLEPGIYEPSMGGVRIEDMYVIRNQKLEQLTHASKELIVI